MQLARKSFSASNVIRLCSSILAKETGASFFLKTLSISFKPLATLFKIKIRIKKVLSLFAGVNLKSVYYPLQVLERKGLILKRISREGKRPQRFVYALTKRGEARFNELLSKSLLDFTRPQFSLDLSLYFLDYLKPVMARWRLRGRIFILNKVARGLKEML
ncbi:MAG TPA: helix-turn-helix transcriptional regulator, partial [Candidatus Margulisiibacteriota bacterium]|nr:helix-turn-helix transcriptional regulator [Candidatus Margulisiibacteriota bacterium]